ncbi:MAG TPA: polyprenyl synthetase family protein [bacterium]|nr:polyprenyl synthetase family protein [bacterium]
MAKTLEEAMRYAIFPGGKRIRPVLVIAVSKTVGIPTKKILPAACGVELIHSFSLIHDDLPCMDNDDFRRGKPSCHKKFGEAEALLAGDALLCLGIKEIAKCKSYQAVIRTCDALGSNGMAGGQSIDMKFKNKPLPADIKIWLDRKKTGELFSLCFELPAIIGQCELNIVKKLKDIGIVFGEAFQILDDIDDREGDKKILEEQLKRRCHILVNRTKNLKGRVDLLLDVIKTTFTDFVKI